MPTFLIHFNDGRETIPSDIGIEFADFEQAYLGVCAGIQDMARELLLQRKDPLGASYIIADGRGQTLMTVPFSDILSPLEWQLAKARRRPHGGPRSAQARNDLALASFRRMFMNVDAGCVLLTPEMDVVEMTEFGARHSHVDQEAIRGVPIFDIFADLRGEPKVNFDRFMSLAQTGATSVVTDLPYLVLGDDGKTANGWWNARTWPIVDDDQALLGFVEWAEPHTAPTHGGKTQVRLGRSVRA